MLFPRAPLLPLVLLAIAGWQEAAASSSQDTFLRGVAPEQAHLYPAAGSETAATWSCLHSGQQISVAAINDDYCDCDDGSDEPGTSACANTTFYCRNEGHLPAKILSSRVNDGICDAACCDGSDENDGKVQCPNRCGPIGKAYRKQQQELQNIRRAGSKIRDKYIADRTKSLATLGGEVARLEFEIRAARDKEQKTKAALEAAESMDKVVLERKMASPLYGTLKSHQDALRAMLIKQGEVKKEMKRLTELLDDLAKNYNPNYQDMAVKGAVVSYRNWRRGGDTDAEADPKANDVSLDEEPNVRLDALNADSGDFAMEKIQDMVDTDPLTLMSDDQFKGTGIDEAGILFRIHEYLPDAVVPYFEAAVDTVLDLFLKANIIAEVKRMSKRNIEGAETESVTVARTAHRNAQDALRRAEQDMKTKRDEMDNAPEKWGRQGEFKALDGVKVSKNLGEYTYELVFFGSAVQVPNRGHGRVTLGRFERFAPANESLTPSEEGYYVRQMYADGQRCWNGPDRSFILDLECGPENALLDVFEAEKCIYSARATTPAVCLPLEGEGALKASTDSAGKDEL